MQCCHIQLRNMYADVTASAWRQWNVRNRLNSEIQKAVLTIIRTILTILLFCPLQSEIRVRHREETKNVTRLTMENVSSTNAD